MPLTCPSVRPPLHGGTAGHLPPFTGVQSRLAIITRERETTVSRRAVADHEAAELKDGSLLLVVARAAAALDAVVGGEHVGAVRDEQVVVSRGVADR